MAKKKKQNSDTVRNPLDIDLNLLDDEWVNQPKMFGRVARKLADAEYDHDKAKAAFDVTVATLRKKITEKPKRYGIADRVTEGAIEAAMILESDYQLAKQEVIDAKHRMGILSAAVKAWDQRKTALTKLVDLHGQDYFSSPSQPKRMSQERREELEHKRTKAIRTSRDDEEEDNDDNF